MSNTIAWGVIGLGRITRKFIHDLQYSKQGRLYAVASRSKEKAISFQAEHNVEVAYGNYQALLADPEVKVVYIGTPHHLHYPLLLECIAHGKNVLCEKPICINSDQLAKVLRLANEKGVFVMEALWTRFLPVMEELLTYLQGQDSPIYNITADFCFPTTYDKNSRLYDPFLGGGSLLDIGIYPLFLSYVLKGLPVSMDVWGVVEKGVDLNTTVMMRYDDGGTALLSSDIRCSSKNEAMIKLKEETIVIPGRWHEANYFEVHRDHSVERYSCPRIGLGYFHEIEHVHEMIYHNHQKSNKFPLEKSMEVLQLMDKIRAKLPLSYPNEIEKS